MRGLKGLRSLKRIQLKLLKQFKRLFGYEPFAEWGQYEREQKRHAENEPKNRLRNFRHFVEGIGFRVGNQPVEGGM